MAIPLFDLIGPRAIKRGLTYNRFTISLPGNKTAWIPRGSIRDNYKEDGGNLLVEWRFDTAPAYDSEADTTTFFPELTPEDTTSELLSPTILQSETKPPRVGTAYLTDFEFENPDNGKVIGSEVVWVQVKKEVT